MTWEVITAAPSVAALRGALEWAVLLAIPGATWAWALRRTDGRPGPGAFARTLVAGLIATLIVVLGLAAGGRYTAAKERWAIAWIAALGAALGRRQLISDARGAIGAAILLAIGALIAIALPRRGEWILGGWDPGVYIHQGVTLERSGSLGPMPDPLFAALEPDEIAVFTRPEFANIVAWPAVPVDIAHRTFEPFFPHAWPAWIARAHRCMGLRGALRANHLAAWLVLLLAAPAACSLGMTRRAAGFATTVLAAHPLLIHHTAFPTAELLQLSLWFGLALLWAHRRTAGPAIGFAALLGLGVVARPSFLPFGAMLTALAALDEARDARRRAARWRRLLQIGALAAGAAFVMRWNGPLLLRWGPTTTVLGAGFAVFGLGALLVDLAASLSAGIRRLAARPALDGALIAAAVAAGLVAVSVAALVHRDPASTATVAWASGAVVYAGSSLWLAALLGWWIIGVRRDPDEHPLRLWLAFLLASVAAALVSPQITIWWPWASRRLLEAALPAIALGVGAALDRLGAVWPATRVRWRPVGLALAFALVALPQARRWRAAARATEYDGATEALAPIIAALGPRDLVVADHFWWGAPVRFLAEVPALNGELLWAGEDEGDRQRLAMDVLARLHREGWQIRLLTSTETGLGVYDRPWDGAQLDIETPAWTARELVQHPRARGYSMRDRLRRFRLYTWRPAAN